MQGIAGRPKAEIERTHMRVPVNFNEQVMKSAHAAGMAATDFLESVKIEYVKKEE